MTHQTRAAIVGLVLALAIVGCSGASPAAPARSADATVVVGVTIVASTPTPQPTIAQPIATATATPAPTHAPAPTDTPTPAPVLSSATSVPDETAMLPADSNTAKAVSLMVVCGFNIELTQSSIDAAAKDGAQLGKLAAALVAGTIISETLGMVSNPPPASILEATWSRCQRVMETVKVVFRDWYNDQLAADKVAEALAPARAELELMLAEVQSVARSEQYTDAQVQAHAQQVLDQLRTNLSKIGG